MTGLEAQYFNGPITALRIMESQTPPAGQTNDADWADTLSQQIIEPRHRPTPTAPTTIPAVK